MAKTLDITKIKAKLDGIAEGFTDKVAKVGFFETSHYEDGTPVAYVAAIQEFGSPETGTPPRPFMKPTVDAQSATWSKHIGDGMRAVVRGAIAAEDVLDAVGDLAARDVQKRIKSNLVAPLSPITILLRQWRREGREITGKTVGEAAAALHADPSLIDGLNADPLQDTGLMVASVQHAVGPAE